MPMLTWEQSHKTGDRLCLQRPALVLCLRAGDSLYLTLIKLKRVYGQACIYGAESGNRRSHSSADGGSYLSAQYFNETCVNR